MGAIATLTATVGAAGVQISVFVALSLQSEISNLHSALSNRPVLQDAVLVEPALSSLVMMKSGLC